MNGGQLSSLKMVTSILDSGVREFDVEGVSSSGKMGHSTRDIGRMTWLTA